MVRRPKSERNSSDGFTLIELLIAAALTVLVVTIVGGIFLSLSRANAQVGSVTKATTAGQLVSTSIGRGVRNASGIQVRNGVDSGDLLLRARTAGSGSEVVWGCAAWYYSAALKTIRYTTSPSIVEPPASATAQASWTLLAAGVTPVPAVGATPSPAVFATSTSAGGSQTLALSFRVAAGTGSPVVIRDGASTQPAQTGTPACF